MLAVTLFLSLFLCAHTFQIDFWGGSRCRNTPEGEYHHVFNDDFPCFEIPTNAESATVTSEESADENMTVQFYSSGDCSQTAIASTNYGCIDFTATGGNALSYDIKPDGLDERSVTNSVTRESKAARRAAVAPAHWTTHQQEARKGLDQSKWTGSLSPHWDPFVGRGEGVGHGDETVLDGETWKWQQIALGIFVGIPKAEWDDNVHTRNDQFIPWTDNPEDYADTDAYNIVSRTNQSVSARQAWTYAQCRALLSCGRRYVDAFHLNNGWAQTIRAIQRVVPTGRSMYDFLAGTPTRVSITISAASTGAGTLVGWGIGRTGGGATAQDNDQLGNCAGTANQADAFIAAFLQNGGGEDSAAEVNITLPDGHILSVSAVVYERFGEPASGFQCGVDN
ncbi:hypothetical protein BDW59DRAFT_160123 [Aspergillus cavernicola]|uniref:Concanavalin A-like lectin/glucanase domain-containing protein n=1 Tax=Aspergillus cavernicola TaxID=176166 RepID=A0ABR4IJ59_9EURO